MSVSGSATARRAFSFLFIEGLLISAHFGDWTRPGNSSRALGRTRVLSIVALGRFFGTGGIVKMPGARSQFEDRCDEVERGGRLEKWNFRVFKFSNLSNFVFLFKEVLC